MTPSASPWPWPPAPRQPRQARTSDAFGRHVYDALAHLYDPVYLQTHALAEYLRRHDPNVPPARAGGALRQRLLDAIALLRPDGAAPHARGDAWRGHRLLTLRYAEACAPDEVRSTLGLSRAQYFREQSRAVRAVVALLAEQWPAADGSGQPPAGGDGSHEAVSVQADGSVAAGSSPHARRDQLPAYLTSFVGRTAETRAVRSLLAQPDVRLVTLTGPGGTGKTRLAAQVASDLGREAGCRVLYVALASVAHSAAVLPSIAEAAGVRLAGGQSLLEQLRESFRDGDVLLVLDNFEHVAGATGELVELLLACPRLKALITSRAVLRRSGEHVFQVPPLPLPEAQPPPAAETGDPQPLLGCDAVRLFVDRARAVCAHFRLTEANGATVAEICRRLDGLPLAIELAAARVRLLTPAALLGRLDRPLSLLTAGAHDLPVRHQTMRRTIGWSYDLLGPMEQTLFRCLAVFVGGFTIEAAAAVGVAPDPERSVAGLVPRSQHSSLVNAESDVLDALASLVDKSLLRHEEAPGGECRYVMLETIRDYALEQLEACGEADAALSRHGAYCLALVADAERGLLGPQPVPWLTRLGRERANLRAALCWSLEGGDAAAAVRIGAAVWRAERVAALSDASRALWQRLGQMGDLAPLAPRLSALLQDVEDYAQATVLREEPGTGPPEPGGGAGIATALLSLGDTLVSQNDLGWAATLYRECLTLCWDVGERSGLVRSLDALANLAARRGLGERAARLAGAAAGLRAQLELAVSPAEQAGHERTVEMVRGELNAARFAAAWAAGRAETIEQTVADALTPDPPDAAPARRPWPPSAVPAKPRLTPRESEVAALVARGLTNKQIAAELFITPRTAETHIDRILSKLGFTSRAQVAAWVARRGLPGFEPGHE